MGLSIWRVWSKSSIRHGHRNWWMAENPGQFPARNGHHTVGGLKGRWVNGATGATPCLRSPEHLSVSERDRVIEALSNEGGDRKSGWIDGTYKQVGSMELTRNIYIASWALYLHRAELQEVLPGSILDHLEMALGWRYPDQRFQHPTKHSGFQSTWPHWDCWQFSSDQRTSKCLHNVKWSNGQFRDTSLNISPIYCVKWAISTGNTWSGTASADVTNYYIVRERVGQDKALQLSFPNIPS